MPTSPVSEEVVNPIWVFLCFKFQWYVVSGIVDTGADITIISADTWPQLWPTTAVGSIVAGLGDTTQTCLSSNPVLVKNPQGQMATIHTCVTVAPLNLWGRDVL